MKDSPLMRRGFSQIPVCAVRGSWSQAARLCNWRSRAGAGGEPAGPSYQDGPAGQPSGGQFTQLPSPHSTLFNSPIIGCSHHPVQGSAGLHCSAQQMRCGAAAAAVRAQDQRLWPHVLGWSLLEPPRPHINSSLVRRLRFHWKGGHVRPAHHTAGSYDLNLISAAHGHEGTWAAERQAGTKMRASQTTSVHPVARCQHMFQSLLGRPSPCYWLPRS